MALELLFLGTGTSAGVPMIGCRCEVCRSADPRDQRSRPSVLIGYPDARSGHDDSGAATYRRLLVDCAPELRLQMLRHGIERLDGVLFTHAHADHIFGVDDLRRFNTVMDGPIDIFAERATFETLRTMFRYIFESHANVNQSWVAQLLPRMLEAGRPVTLFGATWTPLRLLHGRLPILGYRVDFDGQSLAYCTDVSAVPPESFPLLEGLDVLVIDGLRYRHHPTHFTVDQALEVIDRVAPRQAYLTHIAHDISHADLDPRLPAGVHLSYDGLRVTCDKRVEAGSGSTVPP